MPALAEQVQTAVQDDTLVYASFLNPFGTDNENDAQIVDPARPALKLDASVTPRRENATGLSALNTESTMRGKAYANAGCLHVCTNAGGTASARLVMSDTQNYMMSDFTMEMFFKCNGMANVNNGNGRCYLIYQNSMFYFYVNNSYSAYGYFGQYSGSEVGSGKGLADNAWHHIAITWDEDAKTLSYYIDYAYKGARSLPNGFAGKTGNLYIACGVWGNTGYNLANAYIDEFRITKRCLSPREFMNLNRWPVDNDTVGYLSLDSSYAAMDAIPGLAMSAVHGNNASPGVDLSTSAVSNVLYSGTNEIFAGFADVRCYHTDKSNNPAEQNGGGWAIPDLSPTSFSAESFTAEMFFRMPQAPGNESYLFYHDKSWYAKVNGNGRLRFAACPTKRDNGYIIGRGGERGIQVADDSWHHLAYVYDKPAGKVTAYLDYAPAAEMSGISDLVGANCTRGDEILVGGQCKNGNESTWWSFSYSPKEIYYDSIRFTQRALDPMEFLAAKRPPNMWTPPGFILIVR